MRLHPKSRRHSRANRQSGSDRGIRPENSKATSLGIPRLRLGADGYCDLTTQELRARAQKRLENELLLERNYEQKMLI